MKNQVSYKILAVAPRAPKLTHPKPSSICNHQAMGVVWRKVIYLYMARQLHWICLNSGAMPASRKCFATLTAGNSEKKWVWCIIYILKPKAVKWAKRCYQDASLRWQTIFWEPAHPLRPRLVGCGPASFFAARSGVRLCAMYSPLLITTNFIRHRARWVLFSSRACGIDDDGGGCGVSPFVNELEFRISAFRISRSYSRFFFCVAEISFLYTRELANKK